MDQPENYINKLTSLTQANTNDLFQKLNLDFHKVQDSTSGTETIWKRNWNRKKGREKSSDSGVKYTYMHMRPCYNKIIALYN